MKKILFATDLADNSDRAMEKSLKLAKKQKASLHILHVLPNYKKNALLSPLKHNAREQIKSFLDEYQGYSNLDIKIIVEDGNPYAKILEYADKIKADLIIMGLHGKVKFRDLFVGTTVERVIRKGTRPVLMVKNKSINPYENIISAIDFAPASRGALRLALDLFPKANFEIMHTYLIPHSYPTTVQYAIQINDNTEKTQQKTMSAFINTEKHHYKKEHNGKNRNLPYQLSEGDPCRTLVKKAKTSKADLITIGAHGKSMLTPSKLGGVAEDILANPPCDVLVVKE